MSKEEKKLRLFNTLTLSVEPLELQEPGHLRMYSCGPTVYDYAHIGNFRTFLTADLIVRTARAIGLKTTYVSNITDVGHLTEDDMADTSGEDRMSRALQTEEGRFPNVWALADHFTEVLCDNWGQLNLIEPDVRPRASQHMREQILTVERLIDAGHAYETENAVYFSVPSFPEYGKLSGNTQADQLEAGVRDVVIDSEKRDPRDFALWKKDEKHLMQWYSPWGWGFPGWHLECSVMAMQYLGESFDLHAGGEDLIFPHHECEIAQAESLTGKAFAKYWVHTRFLQVEGKKMSKSEGNYLVPEELMKPVDEGGRGIEPAALRLALISGYYRKPYNFTEKHLRDSARIVSRYRKLARRAHEALSGPTNGVEQLAEALDASYEACLGAMLEDLNTPKALAAALEGVKAAEKVQSLSSADGRLVSEWLDKVDALLGFVAAPEQVAEPGADKDEALAEAVETLIEERAAARSERNWARADEIRDELDAMGVELQDSAEGTTWRLKTATK
jgi:cysteinyl-tRNA synthetase